MIASRYIVACVLVVWFVPSAAFAATAGGPERATRDEGDAAKTSETSEVRSRDSADAAAQSATAGHAVRGILAGGPSAASFLGLSITAAHVDVGLGAELGRLSIPIMISGDLGKTDGGLGTGEVTASGGFQGILGPVRLGGGLSAGYGWLSRAASSSLSHIGMYVLDVFALATVDVVKIGDRRAIYLGVKPSVGVRWGESFFAWGHNTLALRGTVMAGVRF